MSGVPVTPLRARRLAKGAGVVLLALVALDLLATAATFILGVGFLKR
jgi:hypothetical protein